MARIGRAAYASVLVAVGGACLSIFESSALAWGYPEDFASFDRVWMRLALGLAALIGAPVLVGAWLLPGKALHLVGAAWGALASALLAYHAGSPFVLGALLCLLGAGAGARLIAARGARPAGIVALALAIVLAAAPPPWSSSRAPAWSAAEAERPGNVIFIVIDTLRADHLSAWGYQAPQAVDPATSPVIDALAADGVRFAQAYAQAPWTRPSAASYLTGLYPQSHAIATQFDRLSEQVPTLAEFLRDAGFRTVGFSANPQVSPPFGLSQGFDRFWNPSSYFQSATFLRAVRRHPWVTAVESQLRPQPAASAGPPQRGIPNSDADAVNRAVRGWMQGVSDDRPTFLYLHYLDPHDPYNAPVDYLYSDPDSHRQRDESVFHADRLVPPRPLQGSIMDSTSDAELRDHIRRYDTEIRFVDTRLGELLDELRAAGLYRQDRDLVILTSDHGEEFYEHQQWLHGQSLYEEMKDYHYHLLQSCRDAYILYGEKCDQFLQELHFPCKEHLPQEQQRLLYRQSSK